MSSVPKRAVAVKRPRFIQLPDEMLMDHDLSDTALRVYGIIVNAYFGKLVDIREERIAERLGRGRTKHAVIAAIKQLAKKGKEYIRVHRVGRHNVYEVIGCPGATKRASMIQPSAPANGRPSATNPDGNGRLAATDHSEIGRLDTSERSSEDTAISRPGTTSVSIRNSRLTPNDDVARVREEDNEDDETRSAIISKLRTLGLSLDQAQDAVYADLDVAKSWSERGLDGVPTGTGIERPVAFIAWATKAGVPPETPRKRPGSSYLERNRL
jgi:hypothetical protein